MYGMDEDMGDTVGKKSSYGDESLRELGGVGKWKLWLKRSEVQRSLEAWEKRSKGLDHTHPGYSSTPPCSALSSLIYVMDF